MRPWAWAMIAGVTVLMPPALAQSAVPDKAPAAEKSASAATDVQSELQQEFGRQLIDAGRGLVVDPKADVGDQRQTLLRRASLFEEVKEYAKSEADLTTATQLSPPSASIYSDRGYFYMRRGRYGEAIIDFTTGRDLEPRNPRFLYALGRAQAALGNYAAAVDFYGQAIKLSDRNSSFYLARAEAQIHLAQPGLALPDYDRAIDLRLSTAVDRYYAYLGRGYAALMVRDYRGAITSLDRALEIDPEAVDALLWRGYARELSGQPAAALTDYEQAAAVDPEDRSARANVRRLRSN